MSRTGALARIAAVTALAMAFPASGIGQEDVPPQSRTPLAPGDTVLATPAGRYPAGPLHRWLFGSGYRDLWATPVEAPVLDLDRYAGGLTPLRLGGGQQTRSLRFRGEDGLVHNFRSIDKDVSRGLDPQLRATIAADILQDQISALFPLSAMVVAPLLEAAGVLHPVPTLVVMPDDPKLGEFREEFAGILGWIEVRPDEVEDDEPGFAGSSRVVASDRLFERMEEDSGVRVDAEEFLRARLLDFLVGDWDRHPDQWRWAGFEDELDGRELLVFRPVPRDRDWALADIGGLIELVTRVPAPQYVGFSYDYPSVFRQSWNGRGLDRRLLNELTREEFRAVAEGLQSRLSDDVIGDAVGRLPVGYEERIGAELEAALLHRRDGLVELADAYYLLLAGWVDVDATDEDEEVDVTRMADGRVSVEIFDLRDGHRRPSPWYRRVFVPTETEEIRLYLRGGEDRLVVRGADRDDIVLRVVGGGSDDVLVDRTAGRAVHLYDHRGDNAFEPGPKTGVDTGEWEDPDDPVAAQHGARPRDWGSTWIPLPDGSFDPDLGLFLGVRTWRVGYGFRQFPYRTRLLLQAGIGTTTGRPRFGVEWDAPVGTSGLRWRVTGRASGAEVDRFYGLGNETGRTLGDDAYRARHREASLSLELHGEVAPGLLLAAGADLRAWRPDDNPGTLVQQERPYGYADFEVVGLNAELEIDARDDPHTPREGARLELHGRWVPRGLDAEFAYARAGAVLSTYFGVEAPLDPSLALRISGEKTWGTYPYQEAAYIGGAATLRGAPNDRWAGDAALAASAELRLALSEFAFLFPGELGVLALGDAGRVFVDGGDSSAWHGAVGGGLWASFLDTYTGTLVVARGPEETGVYVTLGFPF